MSDKKINNVEFYSDRKCTKTIAIKDIKLGKEFYIKNKDRCFLEIQHHNVEDQIKIAEEMLKNETEPAIDISANCHTPYKCGFWKYCSKHIPSPSVFDLYGKALHFDKKIDYYKKGKIARAFGREFFQSIKKWKKQTDFMKNRLQKTKK